jgi:sugar phosphate isomerase/epimerase
MRLAISNIAWEPTDDERVVVLLKQYAIDTIDIAPGKYFANPMAATADDIFRVRNWWAQRGIAINGMQGLLFGTSGLNMFGSAEVQSAMLAYLDGICRIAAGLGATKLVFGAPKHRDRSGFPDAQANNMAKEFFRRLGDIAAQHGVTFCIEAVPAGYASNFLLTHAQAAAMVREVDHAAIRLLLDSGTIAGNGEDYVKVIHEHAGLVAHVHISEPGLVTLGDGATDHAAMAAQLRACLPEQTLTLEMLPLQNEDNFVALERAINVAIHHYRDASVTPVRGETLEP